MSETSVFTEQLPRRRRRRPEVVITPAPVDAGVATLVADPEPSDRRPDDPQADVQAADVQEPDLHEADVQEPDLQEPDGAEPDAPESDVQESDVQGSVDPGPDLPTENDPEPDDSAGPVEAETPSVGVPADADTPDPAAPVADTPEPDVPEPDAPVVDPAAETVEHAATELHPADTDTAVAGLPLPPAPRRRSRGRALLVAGATLVVGGAVSAFALAGPIAHSVDEAFVAAAQDAGHHVVPGAQQKLIVSAARKICERRAFHSTVAERKATALSPEEVAAVGQTFHGDPRGFTRLALETYCSD